MLISWPSNSSVILQLKHITSHLTPMFIYSGICLFGSLCGIAYAMLNIIGKQIQIRRRIRCDEHDFWHRQLTAWKIKYFFIEQFVYHINQCYGFFLLVVLTSYFVRMINISFVFLYSFIRQNFVARNSYQLNVGLHAFYLIQDFVHFSIIVYLPHLIRQEVYFTLNIVWFSLSVLNFHFFECRQLT